ncbi:MAG: hypothetical protein V3V10_01835 [Planctomycetota bacterium]
MSKRGERSVEKEAYWKRTMAEWRESGLTGRDFCKKKGLNEHLYYSWKRKLRISAIEAKAQKTVAKGKEVQLTQPVFIPLTLKPEVIAENKLDVNTTIEIVIGQHAVHVQPDFDNETLSRVLAVIGGLAENATVSA